MKLSPTHIILAGFMSQEERKKFESLKSDFNKYWVPCVWFTNLAAQARKDGRIRDDIALCLLLEVSQPRTRPSAFLPLALQTGIIVVYGANYVTHTVGSMVPILTLNPHKNPGEFVLLLTPPPPTLHR